MRLLGTWGTWMKKTLAVRDLAAFIPLAPVACLTPDRTTPGNMSSDRSRAPLAPASPTSAAGFICISNQRTETNPDYTVSVIDTATQTVTRNFTVGKGSNGITFGIADRSSHLEARRDKS